MFAGKPFSVGRLPRIVFGAGVFHEIPRIARQHGQCALIVTGNRSLRASRNWPVLLDGLRAAGMHWEHLAVEGEPSPQLVDDAVALFGPKHIDVVIGIGGGSALDAAKAIAGLLKPGNSVLDHLEGVGAGKAVCRASDALHRRADHGRHRQRGDQERRAFRAGRKRLQEILPPRRSGGAGGGGGPGAARHLSTGSDRRQRHGCVHATARIVRLDQGQSIHRRACLVGYGGGA